MTKKMNDVKIIEKGQSCKISINDVEQSGVIGYRLCKEDFDSSATLEIKLAVNEVEVEM